MNETYHDLAAAALAELERLQRQPHTEPSAELCRRLRSALAAHRKRQTEAQRLGAPAAAVHPVSPDSDQQQPQYALRIDGSAYALGDYGALHSAYTALVAAFEAGRLGRPLAADDPRLANPYWISTPDAVLLAHDYDGAEYPLEEKTQHRIRKAGREGRISAERGPDGWRYNRWSLQQWLRDERAHAPGPRPEEEIPHAV